MKSERSDPGICIAVNQELARSIDIKGGVFVGRVEKQLDDF
jgi:hypothetical protein